MALPKISSRISSLGEHYKPAEKKWQYGWLMRFFFPEKGRGRYESCRCYYEWWAALVWDALAAREIWWVMSHMLCCYYEWCLGLVWDALAARQILWVTLHVWIYMSESCHTYEYVMSHMWMRHVTRMNGSCHTYEWVMSDIWTRHVSHMNESCPTYK